MSVAMKKGVVLLVVLFLGWLLFTDPSGLADLVGDAGSKSWAALEDLFEAISSFIGALGD